MLVTFHTDLIIIIFIIVLTSDEKLLSSII